MFHYTNYFRLLMRSAGFCALLNLVLIFPAVAATFTVNSTADSGAGSLRQAIISANATADDDTIEFSSALTGLPIALTSGQIDITNPVIINGLGAPGLFISGNANSRVFYVEADVSFESLTIQDGNDSYGAGIYNNGGTLNVTNCTISSNNASSFGGGIKNTGTLNVINSTFSSNTAASIGGGILNYGSAARLTVKNSKFDGNTATAGGGIYNEGSLDIIDSSFATNAVTSLGGGIANLGAIATVKSSTFSQNNSDMQGGGIYNSNSSDLTITNSTFSENNASTLGGGIFNAGTTGTERVGNLVINNSTFSQNHANSQGGGIYNDGDLTIANSIVSANYVNSGGYGPEIFNGTVNGGGNFSPSGNNVFGFNNGVGITENTTIFAGDCHCVTPSTHLLTDIIGALQDNGGSTQTRAPVIGGLAQNHGDNLAIPIGLEYDQRGSWRILDGIVDIGAVEIGVVPLNDTGITWCGNVDTNYLSCPVFGFPRQDADSGRDAIAKILGITKTGGGNAGFDFTKLDAGGIALDETASSWDCVRDNVTGLIWEIKTNDGGLHDQYSTYTWYDSSAPGGSPGISNGGSCSSAGHCDTEKFVAEVNTVGLCGFNDWRMPTVKELTGIVDYSGSYPAIDSAYFPNTGDSWYWSGSPVADYWDGAWHVDFNDGNAYSHSRYGSSHVRLVRGGQSFNTFTDNGDGTVTQTNTGLTWAKCSQGQTGADCESDVPSEINWSTALTSVNNSLLGGHNDWRLPNIKELQSLVDYSSRTSAINIGYFPNTPPWEFWSGSPNANFSDNAWSVDFNWGNTHPNSRNDAYLHVRFVRGGQSFDAFDLNVVKTGSGIVTSDAVGIDCGVTCAASYYSGNSVTLTATPFASAAFSGWSDGDCSGTGDCVVTMDAATTVTATFTAAPTYALTVTTVGNGTVTATGINCGGDCSETYTTGTSVTLSAAAATGFTFSGWSGACSGTGDCTVTMNSAKNVTATFTVIPTYTLTVTKNGTDSGTVISDSGEIDCGTICSATFGGGARVTLRATPNIGYAFSGWSGGDCSGAGTCDITMNSAKSVIATFTVIPTYALTVTTVGNGIVTSDPNGINCSSTCSANFNDGTSVTLFAVGTAGYRFSGWSGACSGTGDCIVTTDAAKSVTAIFTTIPTYTLTVIKNGIDSGTVTSDLTGIDCGATCSANFTDGAWITLTAAPNIGYAFSQWSSECLSLPTNPLQCQINIMAATTVTATFVTAGLNDTGISACSDTNTNGQICPLAAFPDQDAELGRDAENIAGTLIKTGDGNAGFDFTKISNIGAVLPATASLGNGDNDWACTRDNVTGLIWEVKSDSDADFWYMNATYNWGEAVTYYVSNMNDHHRCGFSDWRMPSEKELLGIVDYNQSIPNPTIDSNYFPNTRSYWFWSSSLDVSNSSYAWGVYFGNGYANRANQNNNFHVRLVRGQATVNSFIDNGDTVTQTNTGLMWAKCSAGQTSPECTTGTAIEMAWSDALTAANSSNLGGYSDWRIPNIKELQSLANYDTFNPTIDSVYFPNTPANLWYWSGSPDTNLSSYAWYLNVSNGYVSYDLRSAGNHVRFVRDALFLSIIKAGTGSGTVTSDVGGINCGADCIKTYGVGTSVILSATAATDSIFTGWSGGVCSGTGSCTVTMDAAKTVTATFDIPYPLTITNNGHGTVTGPYGCIDGGCENDYAGFITLTATPDAGYQFAGWSGACSDANVICNVPMTAAQDVMANFTMPSAGTGSDWQVIPPPVTDWLYGVTWSGSQFVAVGGSGKILTSPDGVSWTAQTSNTTNNLWGITWSGSKFVAVGDSDTILTSSNGTSWTTRTSGTANTLYGVTWSGSQFLAVGDNGAILTSLDGLTWTSRTSGTTYLLDGVTWSGTQFMVVGDSTILTSPDGVTWTLRITSTADFESVTWSGTRFVVVGSNGTILTSSNGITWNTEISPTYWLDGVTWNGTQFVAVGRDAKILTSSDGANWTIQESGTSSALLAVTWNGSRFVAVGANGTILISPPTPQTLTVNKNGTGTGIITSDVGVIDCGLNCNDDFNSGTSVTLTAAPTSGSILGVWGGCIPVVNNPWQCQVTMSAAKTVTATFITAGLNDTGITKCANATTNDLDCSSFTGFPDQDAEHGSNSFNFTKLDASGNPLPASATNHVCVKDNVTGLIWEVKTDNTTPDLRDKDWTYTWYNSGTGTASGGTCKTTGRCDTEKFVADVNTSGLCGFNDWRMPYVKELTGIADLVRNNPAIDIDYFPNTLGGVSTFFGQVPPASLMQIRGN